MLTTAYIRQGSWCLCERSCNSASLTLEDGVSVYEARQVAPGKWEPHGVAWAKRARCQQPRFLGYDQEGRAPWFLVTGRRVGTGFDGEPVLKEVLAHQHLQWDGSQYFDVVGAVHQQPLAPHPGYPECYCKDPSQDDAEEEDIEDAEEVG